MTSKTLTFISHVLIAGSIGTAPQAFGQAATIPLHEKLKANYRPVEVERVSEIKEPIGSVGYGTVVLDVLISEKGEVRDVEVRRAVAPVTEEAIRAVRTSTFQPAELDGKAVVSRMTVAVTVTPHSLLGPNVLLTPLIHQGDETRVQSAFQPPEVTHATYPIIPGPQLGPVTVILEVTLDETGKAQSTKILRDLSPFTAAATRAVEDWRFIPATLNGAPLKSKVLLAFIFSQAMNNY